MPRRFDPGRVVATPAALAALFNANASLFLLLARHAAGDWGELGEQDRQANEDALATGCRLMSVYRLDDDTVVWVITNGAGDDGRRFCTTILMPEDY